MDFKQKLLKNPKDLQKLDIDFQVEIANKELPLKEILDLKEGSAFVFDEDVASPLSMIIKGQKVAEGILVKTKNGYGMKITKTALDLEN
jgi:flagellar motor switch/type III secretory pathway protein FliN